MNQGDVIDGRFELECRAGSGGMGTVFRARDRQRDALVAVKIVRAGDAGAAARFAREANALAELRHDGIVGYLAHGTLPDGGLYLAMEWLDGEDLAARLEVSTLSIAETLAVGARAAAALALAHDRGIVHRDVKPSNLFLVEWQCDRVKLLDFGVARIAELDALTTTGMVIGTPLFMAPEQAFGRSIDARADVFALGAVLFRCLTGRGPFPASTIVELSAQLASPAEAPRVRSLAPGVPAALDDLIARMLAKDPARRPANASAVHGALVAIDPARVETIVAPVVAAVESRPSAPASLDEQLARAAEALEAGRWQEARLAFEALVADHESAQAHAGLAEALWWLGDPKGRIEHLERAYAIARRSDDRRSVMQAAVFALALASANEKMLGNRSAWRGWVARAARLLGDEPTPLHGWLWFAQAMAWHDARSFELVQRALAHARATGDRDLELCTLAATGEHMIYSGDVEGGMTLIDEALVGTLAGEYQRKNTVVITTCIMIIACDQVADLERAVEWCRAADPFIARYGCPFLFAECRGHYGGVLVSTGRWSDAERELSEAIAAAPSMTEHHAKAVARLAQLRLLQGRFDDARGLVAAIADRPYVRPIVAALSLVDGKPAVAIALLRRYVDACDTSRIDIACALALLVDAYLAIGDLPAATAAGERLRTLQSDDQRDRVAALASFAAGRISLAQGDREAARRELERAIDLFTARKLPHDAARVRVVLAQVLASDDPELARIEATCAASCFAELGASRDHATASALLRSLG
ncbi:MAG TPA: protein kinase [Kofleriaceae bacterium]|nr:protein kinase [Kofleriaceae bacterium]